MPIHDELELLVSLSGAFVVCALWVRLVVVGQCDKR